MVLSRRTVKRMDNIKGFCDFDTEEKTATVHLKFKSVEEIIESRLSTADAPIVSTEATEMLERYLEFVPNEFKVNFSIEIEDYMGYDSEKLKEAFNNTIEVSEYRAQSGHSSKQSRMAIFVVVGLIMLMFMFFNSKYKWFSEAGLPISATIAFVLELMFELYFEEGMSHFVVSKLYDKFGTRGTGFVFH